MVLFDRIAKWVSARILAYINTPTDRYAPYFAPDPEILHRALRPGDVLLVEGDTRLASIIKFLTQSSWSHAALYIGELNGADPADPQAMLLLEARAEGGVITVPMSRYARFNTRICRPVGLSQEDRNKVVRYAIARIGKQYDTRQIIDLARYLFPYPPVPIFLRRRMLAIGAGDPTKAICSTLIAEAFASIHYPILPERVEINGRTYGVAPYVQSEVDHIRHHGLFTPRDFDVSPFFAIIKPTIESGFDYRSIAWDAPADAAVPEPDLAGQHTVV